MTLCLPVTMNFNWTIQFIRVRMEFQFSSELKQTRFVCHFPLTLPPIFLSIDLLELTVPENRSLFGIISLTFATK